MASQQETEELAQLLLDSAETHDDVSPADEPTDQRASTSSGAASSESFTPFVTSPSKCCRKIKGLITHPQCRRRGGSRSERQSH